MPGGCWPDAEQELLLAACVREGEAALEGWQRWRERVGVASADAHSLRLVPLAYRRLSELGVPSSELSDLKGAYRLSWSRTQMLFFRTGSAVAQLEGAGIRTLVLKGAAVALLDYGDPGTRPMSDIDVLVAPEDASRAMQVLADLGWRPLVARPAQLVGILHGHPFTEGENRGIDLHWQALQRRQSDQDLWDGAVPLELRGAGTLAPDPAWRLLHSLVHGAESGDPPAIRWVTDAAAVLRANDVDWDALVGHALARGVTLIAARSLAYLRETFALPIPGEPVEALAASPHSRFERASYRAAMRPRTIANVLRQEWFRYRRLHPRPPPGFLTYLRASLLYEHRRDLAGHAVRRILHGPADRAPAQRA
jgi:Uncharacterised nucleotidyltransferase